MPCAPKIWLSQEQCDDFQRFARSHTLPARLVERARILLAAAAGKHTERTALELGIARQTVARWRLRFSQYGIAGIEKDAPRSGRPRLILPHKIDEIVSRTTRETPPSATHWSTRTLAQATGISPSSVGRIWRAHGLQPHRIETFKLSNDPRFAEKLEDVITLYRNPPQGSLVFSLDEKCQIQALDRTQPGLPWKKGRCGTMTQDYKRNGTTTPFAAMNIQDGTVIDVCIDTRGLTCTSSLPVPLGSAWSSDSSAI